MALLFREAPPQQQAQLAQHVEAIDVGMPAELVRRIGDQAMRGKERVKLTTCLGS
jgi:hypothetical protein